MSQFLMVAPEGWTDVTEGWSNSSGDVGHLSMLIGSKNWVDVQSELQSADINGPEGTVLVGATLMSLDDGTHLWVRFE